MSVNDEGYKIALEEGREGVKEGGVGVGSAVMSADGKLLGRGRNMRYTFSYFPLMHES
jgi:cytosine/creatinine deaminase